MFHEHPTAIFEIGSIGYDDEDTHFDLGTTSNDGYTLVKVQLFKGRDVTQPLNPKRAQGTKLLCHINAGQRIPPKDTRCYIAIPPGMEQTPGAGFIVGTVEKTLDGRLDDDRTVMDFGDQHVIIKGESVTLAGNDGSFVSVGYPKSGGANGVSIQGPDGSGMLVQEGVAALYTNKDGNMCNVLELTTIAANLVSLNNGQLQFANGGFVLTAKTQGFITPPILALGPPSTAGYKPVTSVTFPACLVNSPNILISTAT